MADVAVVVMLVLRSLPSCLFLVRSLPVFPGPVEGLECVFSQVCRNI